MREIIHGIHLSISACRGRRGVVLDCVIDPPFSDNELHIKSDTFGTFGTQLKTTLYIDFYIARPNPVSDGEHMNSSYFLTLFQTASTRVAVTTACNVL